MTDWRTLTIFVDTGKDINIVLHGEFSQWELEAILIRSLEKISEGEVVPSMIEPKEVIDGPDDTED